jgi:MSHA biogenesis protein MshJ
VSAAERLSQWRDARKPRERLLLAALVATAFLCAGYALALKPVRDQIAASSRQLQAAQSELTRLQQLVEERDRAGEERLRARQAELQGRLAAAQSEIHRAQVDLVPPQEMARQLAAILRRFPQLRVVGMVSEPPAPVDEHADANGKAPVPAEARNAMLYSHGLELTVQGRYLDLVAYLQQLEHAPHRIYWRELELKVDPQGVPLTRIRFFTLSRGPAWLAL